MKKGGETLLVQCKQWRAVKVWVTIVRELYGVMAAEGVTGGFVVTSGVFTAEAQTFAVGRNIELVDGEALHALIRAVSVPAKAASASPAAMPADSPPCPVCQSAMVRRTAKRGASSGNEFWVVLNTPPAREHGLRNLFYAVESPRAVPDVPPAA